MHNLFTIEDSTILSMAQQPAFVEVVPCLKGASAKLSRAVSCGQCQRTIDDRYRQTMRSLRQCIGSLPATRRQALRKLLNAKKVRVSYSNGKGKRITLTF